MDLSHILSNEVCSLELAQKLKYLGIEQTSLHCYYKSNHVSQQTGGKWVDGITLTYQAKPHGKQCPAWCAYTTSELGLMLPSIIIVTGVKNHKGLPLDNLVVRLRIERCKIIDEEQDKAIEVWVSNYVDQYCAGRDIVTEPLFPHHIYDEKEANLRAKILIALIETGFVKVDSGIVQPGSTLGS